jgi:TRAP-type mannitol/chloroaromatic compound transport system permease small subunit
MIPHRIWSLALVAFLFLIPATKIVTFTTYPNLYDSVSRGEEMDFLTGALFFTLKKIALLEVANETVLCDPVPMTD